MSEKGSDVSPRAQTAATSATSGCVSPEAGQTSVAVDPNQPTRTVQDDAVVSAVPEKVQRSPSVTGTNDVAESEVVDNQSVGSESKQGANEVDLSASNVGHPAAAPELRVLTACLLVGEETDKKPEEGVNEVLPGEKEKDTLPPTILTLAEELGPELAPRPWLRLRPATWSDCESDSESEPEVDENLPPRPMYGIAGRGVSALPESISHSVRKDITPQGSPKIHGRRVLGELLMQPEEKLADSVDGSSEAPQNNAAIEESGPQIPFRIRGRVVFGELAAETASEGEDEDEGSHALREDGIIDGGENSDDEVEFYLTRLFDGEWDDAPAAPNMPAQEAVPRSPTTTEGLLVSEDLQTEPASGPHAADEHVATEEPTGDDPQNVVRNEAVGDNATALASNQDIGEMDAPAQAGSEPEYAVEVAPAAQPTVRRSPRFTEKNTEEDAQAQVPAQTAQPQAKGASRKAKGEGASSTTKPEDENARAGPSKKAGKKAANVGGGKRKRDEETTENAGEEGPRAKRSKVRARKE